ncbi:MAG: hypothetical protein FWG87_09760 [Defluviitaleaceae bacterium]|nr:hypothetical protein [Defluviitaleaceae bacterium]
MILWIIGGIFGALLVLMTAPIRYYFKYDGESFLKVRYLFFWWRSHEKDKGLSLPLGKRKSKDKPKTEPSAAESSASEPTAPEPKPEPEPVKKRKIKRKKKLKAWFNGLGSLHQALTDKEVKIMIKQGFTLIKQILSAARPKRFNIYGVVGLGCPFDTAMFFGMYEALVSVLNLRKNIRLTGDFASDTTVIDIKADIRGRIRPYQVIVPVMLMVLKNPTRTILLNLLKGR